MGRRINERGVAPKGRRRIDERRCNMKIQLDTEKKTITVENDIVIENEKQTRYI